MSLLYSPNRLWVSYSGWPWKWTKRLFFCCLTKQSTPASADFVRTEYPQPAIASCLHLVPPGVRYSEGRWNVVHQGMISRLRLSEDTDAFGRQLVALHAIHMQDGRMDGETGIHRRDRILPGPVHDLDERGPIRLVRQAGSFRFGAGHDYSVQAADAPDRRCCGSIGARNRAPIPNGASSPSCRSAA